MTTRVKVSKMSADAPEIFESIQGEGPFIGRPSVFLRVALCNLQCRWCDTPYTWNWEGTEFEHDAGIKYDRESQIHVMTPAEIVEFVSKWRTTHYVFTGGEPLVQQRALGEVARALRAAREHVTIDLETNGTRKPSVEFDALADYYVVSPKLSNAGMTESTRIKDDAMSFFASQTHRASFKFVVSSEQDLTEVLALAERFEIEHDRIFLMPRGATLATMRQNQGYVAELCLEYGFRFSDRLHLRLYGAERGT